MVVNVVNDLQTNILRRFDNNHITPIISNNFICFNYKKNNNNLFFHGNKSHAKESHYRVEV